MIAKKLKNLVMVNIVNVNGDLAVMLNRNFFGLAQKTPTQKNPKFM